MPKIHFVSGLPRAGSTLLSAILRQNPRFHARISGPVAPVFMAVQEAVSAKNESAIFITEKQRRDLLRGIFEAYYKDVPADDVVFDTNRAWCAKISAIGRLYPDARIFCCVRNVAWVIDSIERLVRQNAFELSGIFSYQKSNTVYGRADGLAKGDGMVGFAWNALKEAYYGEDAHRLVLIQYETLTRDPEGTIAKLYDAIGEEPFAHDLQNVVYAEPEFDARLGTPGLHDVKPKVERNERQTVLPPDLFRRFEGENFWLDPNTNARGVTVW